MKIKLKTYVKQRELSYLNGRMKLKLECEATESWFIVDTGSPRTIINYVEAEMLRVKFENLKSEEIIGIGGKNLQSYSCKLKLNFETEEDKVVEEEMEVRLFIPKTKEELKEVAQIPTIIGTDFLREKRFKLFCDLANEIAYLEC